MEKIKYPRSVGIFAKNIDIANRFFDELVGELKYKEIQEIKKCADKRTAILKNGVIYKTVVSNTTARGNKFTDIYIHKDTPKEDIITIIRPSLRPDCDGNYSDPIYFE